MRILHVIQCANLGGMEQSTLLRIAHLRNLGHDCRVVSLNRDGGLAAKLEAINVPFTALTYAGPWGLWTAAAAYAAFREQRADCVLMTGHNLMAQMILSKLRINRKVLAIHYHHQGVKSRRQWRAVYRSAAKTFDCITFASGFIRDEAVRISPAIAGKASVLPNPFEVPELGEDSSRLARRSEWGLNPGDEIIGNAGWLIPRKRFDVFLRVCAAVATRRANLRVVIAGDGPLRSELENLASSLGLRERVRWLGWQSNLSGFYKAIDILAFNSDWDAVGRTPLEALAVGTPFAGSVLNGGPADVLPDDYPWLLRHHDVKRLAQFCCTILENSEQASQVALRARRHLEQFSPEKDVKRLLKLLTLWPVCK